jgi:hypothetical protein
VLKVKKLNYDDLVAGMGKEDEELMLAVALSNSLAPAAPPAPVLSSPGKNHTHTRTRTTAHVQLHTTAHSRFDRTNNREQPERSCRLQAGRGATEDGRGSRLRGDEGTHAPWYPGVRIELLCRPFSPRARSPFSEGSVPGRREPGDQADAPTGREHPGAAIPATARQDLPLGTGTPFFCFIILIFIKKSILIQSRIELVVVCGRGLRPGVHQDQCAPSVRPAAPGRQGKYDTMARECDAGAGSGSPRFSPFFSCVART